MLRAFTIERNVVAAILGLGLAIPIVAAAAAVARVTPASRGLAWAIGALLAACFFAAAWRLRRRFPAWVDGVARRRRVTAGAWLVLAILALAQLGRLSAFMVNPANTFGSAFPNAELTKHMCLATYVEAAALARDGDSNVYDERHWPAFREGEEKLGVLSPVAELGPNVTDPYEYPPPFLLLPRLALALTNHFLIIRAVWFALQWVAFAAVALLLAREIGAREGAVVALLVPALVASLPFLVNLQWGQAHLVTFALSLGALLAFRRGRAPLGGALLGAATVFKLFPGLILLYLALRRRWRELGFTLAASAGLALVALAVFGTAPFTAFFDYHLPRLGSGEAFSFFERRFIAVSRNLSVSGVVFKLGLLGAPGMNAALARKVGWVYSLFLLALVARAARQPHRSALDDARLWLGLLCLGSLRSPLASSIYASLGGLWLLTLFAARAARPRDVVFIVLGFVLIPGGPPLPSRTADVVVAFVGQVIMIAIAVRAVWRAETPVLSSRHLDALGDQRKQLALRGQAGEDVIGPAHDAKIDPT